MCAHHDVGPVSEVYTDGACSGNPGPGGWAWATRDGRQDSGGDPQTTNQRMELRAVLEALRAIPGTAVVHSDSTYVVNAINDRWYDGWLARGWKNSQRKPVANRDLWEPLLEIYLDRRDELTFVWVKGHSGDPMNDLVDELAVAEATALRVGAVAPALRDGVEATALRDGVEATALRDGAEAEATALRDGRAGAGSQGGGAGRVGPAPPWPVDWAVAVTGPGELDDDQRAALVEAIDGLDPGHDVLVSGLRRGAELEAAELALARQIPLAVVLPYADPANRWPRRDRSRFDRCVESASWVVTLDGDATSPSRAIAQRDRWIWQAVVGAVVLGRPGLADELETAGLGVISLDP